MMALALVDIRMKAAGVGPSLTASLIPGQDRGGRVGFFPANFVQR